MGVGAPGWGGVPCGLPSLSGSGETERPEGCPPIFRSRDSMSRSEGPVPGLRSRLRSSLTLPGTTSGLEGDFGGKFGVLFFGCALHIVHFLYSNFWNGTEGIKQGLCSN